MKIVPNDDNVKGMPRPYKTGMPMTDFSMPRWLVWARELQALSQTGLTFSDNPFDTQRYGRLAEIAAEMVESQAGLPATETLANFQVQPGYATPKVDVRGAVIRDGRILLVQERVDGCWSMPGGWADVGDRPSDMVVREVWEESGFQVVPVKLAGVFDVNATREPLSFYHAYKLIFLCEISGGSARPSDETLDVGFFSLDALPPLSLERTDERHLAEVFAHVVDPNRVTLFD